MLVHKRQEWDCKYEDQVAFPQSKTTSPNGKKSPENGEIDWPLRTKCLLFVLTVAFLATVVTAQSAYIVKSGYNLVEAKREIMRLEQANEILKLDIARLKTHERIARIASQKIGMIIPQNAYFSSVELSHEASGADEPSVKDTNAMTGLLNIGFSVRSALERER